MKKPRISLSVQTIKRFLIARMYLLLAVILLGLAVYFGLFVHTHFVKTVFIPPSIPESDITARQIRIDKNLFETLLTRYTEKTAEPAPLESIRNPFSQ